MMDNSDSWEQPFQWRYNVKGKNPKTNFLYGNMNLDAFQQSHHSKKWVIALCLITS